MRYGWKELRDPCPWFSTSTYLKHYPDVAVAGVNPFHHYIRFGKAEGRHTWPVTSDEPLEAVRGEFDADYYIARYPDIAASKSDALLHYMDHGWREHRDPCDWFDTSYYLANNADIRGSGLNPFFHYVKWGRHEGRRCRPFHAELFAKAAPIRVSAIVPNFNHARFLPERLESIARQTYPPHEIIILDDCSTDDSRAIIDRFAEEHPGLVRTLYNEENSGGVFAQWQRGVEAASGDLLWICESDDTCDRHFLENLHRYFLDPSIHIAFGNIQFLGAEGEPRAGLDAYREETHAGIWDRPHVAPANWWFNGPLAVRNVIPNVGGCLIRRQPIPDAVWDEARRFKVCGDWFLYGCLANGGQIAFEPTAKAYFRQHGQNTSVASFSRSSFYEEHFSIARHNRNHFGTKNESMVSMYLFLKVQFDRCHKKSGNVDEFNKLFPLHRVLTQRRRDAHILLAFLGFYPGGGEIFPILLANELVKAGYTVSMMALRRDGESAEMKERLDERVAVYHSDLVAEMTLGKFIGDAGIDLIHSHNVGCEFFFLDHGLKDEVPYVVTHHGSYEVTRIEASKFLGILKMVDHWVYIADRNLERFSDIPIDAAKFTKLGNAVPPDDRDFPFSRADLGIGEEDFVFGVATRAIAGKGWEESIAALLEMAGKASRPAHLVLCGEGEIYPRLLEEYGEIKNVHFLGHRERISGFYRMCDCAVLATRFNGESYPLTLIEAMQAGRPAIATDVGEIRNILTDNGSVAGAIIEPAEDNLEFVRNLAAGMRRMVDEEEFHNTAKAAAENMTERFSMEAVLAAYEEVYRSVGGERFSLISAGEDPVDRDRWGGLTIAGTEVRKSRVRGRRC